MLKFYCAPQSRSFRILWFLEEAKLPHDLSLISLKRGDHKKQDYLAINPMGKVPTVVLDGKVIWESTAIITHLSDVYPHIDLAPAVGRPERADFYRWMSFSTGVMEPAFMDYTANQNPNPSAVGWGTFDSMKKALGLGLQKGPWILGEKFSGADVMIGGNLAWFCKWKKDAFTDVPGLFDYVKRIEERPAYQAATTREAQLIAQIEGEVHP